MKQLAGLTKLQVLDLTGTDVGDAGLAQIAALTNLRELYLNHARFTDKGLLLAQTAAEPGADRNVPDPHRRRRRGGSGRP